MHPKLEEFWEKYGERFTELFCVGGENPSSYGIIEFGGGPYGRGGLTHDEFDDFIRMRSHLEGMFDILGQDAVLWVHRHIKFEIDRVVALQKQEVDTG